MRLWLLLLLRVKVSIASCSSVKAALSFSHKIFFSIIP